MTFEGVDLQWQPSKGRANRERKLKNHKPCPLCRVRRRLPGERKWKGVEKERGSEMDVDGEKRGDKGIECLRAEDGEERGE